jgi:hypothetical protein
VSDPLKASCQRWRSARPGAECPGPLEPGLLDGELVARQGRPFDFYGLAPGSQPRAPASVARRRAAYTTFSTFSWETFVMLRTVETVRAILYLAGSVTCSLAAVAIAHRVGRAISA